jgi:hypothetical protein
MILRRRAALNFFTAAIAIVAGSCVGPPVLQQQVLGYDEVTKRLNDELLLLNIARVADDQAVHFTSTSSIAATFNWTATLGVGGQIYPQASGSTFYPFSVGGSSSENPTFSIVPLSGEDFTKRIATPFRDEVFEFLVYQGGRINEVMRLMAAGIEVQEPDGRFVRFIENDPRRPREYEEFRRIATHLQRLSDNRQLFVRPLVFEDTLIGDFKSIPRAEDINNGFNNGMRWRQKPDGNYKVTRLEGGRVIVANFDPMALTDRQRFELNEKIKKNPGGFVYLDIRPDGPGGNFPIHGAIKLRSMFMMLKFIAEGIYTAPEFDVGPTTSTGGMESGPAATLRIRVTNDRPANGLPYVFYKGRYYSIDDTSWDRTVFRLLNILFQTTVGKVENVGIPITIAK